MAMWPCSSRGTPSMCLTGRILGQALGQHDHAELLAFGLLADPHRGHDPLDDLVEVHHAADFLPAASSG